MAVHKLKMIKKFTSNLLNILNRNQFSAPCGLQRMEALRSQVLRICSIMLLMQHMEASRLSKHALAIAVRDILTDTVTTISPHALLKRLLP